MLRCIGEGSQRARDTKERGRRGDMELRRRDKVGERSKDKKRKDPREVPPSSYDREIFMLNFPFVEVHSMRHRPSLDDRCSKELLLSFETMSVVLEHFYPSLSEYWNEYENCGEEDHNKPLQQAILHDMVKLTYPVEEVSEEAQVDDSQQDLQICFNEGESARDDLSITHEGKVGVGFADFLLKSYDRGILKNNLFSFLEDALCTIMVLEAKGNNLEEVWFKGPGGAFQAAYYAVIEAAENAKKGCIRPIALQCWSKRVWSYGDFVPSGLVKINDEGALDEGQSNLASILKKRVDDLRAYMGDSGAEYGPGTYVVGHLYINEEVLLFPCPAGEGGMLTSDALRFFQGLLRICVGEKVLKWTPADVEAALKRRANRTKRRAHEAFSGWNWENYDSKRKR